MRSDESIFIETSKTQKMLEEELISIGKENYTTNELSHQMLMTYRFSKNVKVFSLIDTVLNLFYVFINPWYLIPSLMSIIGYIGAFKYNINCLYIYFVFQILYIIIRFSLELSFWTSYGIQIGIIVIEVLLVIFSTILGIYVSRFTHKLISSIKLLNSEEFYKLKNIRELKTNFIYW